MDINKLVENYFAPKNLLTKEKLWNLFDEVIQERRVLGGAEEDLDVSEKSPNINISFPKLRITEDFGKLGTQDRAMIEKFARNIPGETLDDKLAALNSILRTKKEGASISEILSTMVICEILAVIITNFTESAGGFIFEGFLAGLFGGKSVQIVDPEDIPGMEAAGKPITDVILGDKHYSLKLLGATRPVKGSFKNMVEHFKVIDHVVYLDARRVDHNQGLQFSEFTITLDNFLDVFVTPYLKQVWKKKPEVANKAVEFKKLLNKLIKGQKAVKEIRTSVKVPELNNQRIFTYSPAQETGQLNEIRLSAEDLNMVIDRLFKMPNKELDQYGPFSVVYAEERFEDTRANKLFGAFNIVERLKLAIDAGNKEEIIKLLEQTPGYQKEMQFEFTHLQVARIGSFREIGTLLIGPKYMNDTLANYTNLLKETISPVYEQLQLFTDNINDYFLGVSGEKTPADRKQYALDAIENAEQLKVATDDAVKAIEK
tara:strand:+ start:897 stop:2354 length:1458 start_codon:yes stop_codon:yes gene_type:complete